MKNLRYIAVTSFAVLVLCCTGCPAQVATPNALATLTITAAPQPAKMTIVPVTTSVQTGTSVVYTVTLTGVSGIVPTGTVQLYNGTTLITGASGNLVNGVATCTINTNGEAPGTYSIAAVYSGDTNYTAGVPPKQ